MSEIKPNLLRISVNQRFVFVKPLWVVIVYISVFVLSGIWNFSIAPQYLSLSLVFLIPVVGLQLYWAFSVCVYLAENDGSEKRGKTTLPKIMLIAWIIGYLTFGITIIVWSFGASDLYGDTLGATLTAGMAVGNLAAFALIGITAFRLETFEKGAKANAVNIIGSFLQIFYFPIGIWFLRPRLEKVKSS